MGESIKPRQSHYPIYGPLRMKADHEILNYSKKERVKTGVFHIQNVNAYHSRLHKWMKILNGLATKDLLNRLVFFRLFESCDSPNEKSILAMQTQLTRI